MCSLAAAWPGLAARVPCRSAQWLLAHKHVASMATITAASLESPTEGFLRELEIRRTQALVARDIETLEALHAPEYELVTPAGKVFSRQAYLGAIEAEPFYAAWEVGHMSFRISPAMAIVRYQARLRFPSGREVVCWHTDSYELRALGWQAVWSQATGVPPAGS